MASTKKSSIVNVGMPWNDTRVAERLGVDPLLVKERIEASIVFMGEHGWKAEDGGWVSLQCVLLPLPTEESLRNVCGLGRMKKLVLELCRRH